VGWWKGREIGLVSRQGGVASLMAAADDEGRMKGEG